VTIEYHTMSSDRDSTRTVEPWGLFFLGSQWYLAANEGGTLKNFRVSRISDAVVNDKQPGTPDFDVPASFDLRAHARSRQAWELGDAGAVEAIVDFTGSSGATVAARRLGEPVDGSPTRRRFQVRRAEPFVRWLLSFAGEARPLAPNELVEQYADLSQRTLAVYADR
jgi:predicted DNA-binding transcriptional regulator YafY